MPVDKRKHWTHGAESTASLVSVHSPKSDNHRLVSHIFQSAPSVIQSDHKLGNQNALSRQLVYLKVVVRVYLAPLTQTLVYHYPYAWFKQSQHASAFICRWESTCWNLKAEAAPDAAAKKIRSTPATSQNLRRKAQIKKNWQPAPSICRW
jgi:hypothetical protein